MVRRLPTTRIYPYTTLFRSRREHARVDEDADSDRHLLFVNEVVEDGGHAELALGVLVGAAVLENHDARRLLGVVLGGDEMGRAHVCTPVTPRSSKPSSS